MNGGLNDVGYTIDHSINDELVIEGCLVKLQPCTETDECPHLAVRREKRQFGTGEAHVSWLRDVYRHLEVTQHVFSVGQCDLGYVFHASSERIGRHGGHVVVLSELGEIGL